MTLAWPSRIDFADFRSDRHFPTWVPCEYAGFIELSQHCLMTTEIGILLINTSMISGYHLTLTFYRYYSEIIIELLTTGIEFGTVANHKTRCLNQILLVNLIIYINLINMLDLFILFLFFKFLWDPNNRRLFLQILSYKKSLQRVVFFSYLIMFVFIDIKCIKVEESMSEGL